MRKVSIKAVLIGGIVNIVISVVLEIPFVIYATAKLDLAHVQKDQISSAITEIRHGNIALYVSQLLVGLACSVFGGYVAAWVAKHDELLNGGLSSFLCVALGIYTVATGKDYNSHWMQVLLLLASPLLGMLGGELMRRQHRRFTMHSLQR